MKRIQAAGGVVMRRGPEETEIAVVHRPRYDDWSFPKGKLDPGETFEEAALREVREETGLICRLGPELAFAHYDDNEGRPKVVRYWLMAVIEDLGFEPNDEVDDLRWLTPADATELLTYSRDRKLVRTL
ncbi:MAG TPA: NUDIX hydrolase [Thermoleophilaceae bacterium]|nr:NUDIX hydrolase [Thermoleophilaceae bacterium]